MLDSSPNQIGFFESDAAKLARAEAGDFESAGSRAKNHCSREERAGRARDFLTHKCKSFKVSSYESISNLS